VFDAGWPVVVVPLDVTMENVFEEAHRDQLAASGSPVARAVAAMLDFYMEFYRPTYGRRCSALHDPLAAAIAVGRVLPTVAPEFRVAHELDSDGNRYSAIAPPVLLLGGGRSPAYLQEVLTLLVDTVPQAKLVLTPEFDHNAPDLGAPAAVAELIRA
jgi:hypothetical protein